MCTTPHLSGEAGLVNTLSTLTDPDAFPVSSTRWPSVLQPPATRRDKNVERAAYQDDVERGAMAYSHSRQAASVRQLFVLAPGMARERDLFFHALLTGSWDSGVDKVVCPQELSDMAARQLRRLYEKPDEALAAVRADAPTHGAAARSVEILKEVGIERNRPLLLETLFIAENMATGPKHFDHAFEIEERFI